MCSDQRLTKRGKASAGECEAGKKAKTTRDAGGDWEMVLSSSTGGVTFLLTRMMHGNLSLI